MTPFNFEIPEEYLSKLAEAAVKNQRGHTALLEAKDREIERMTAKFDELEKKLEKVRSAAQTAIEGQRREMGELKSRIEQLENPWASHMHYRLSHDGLQALDTYTGLIWRRTVEPGTFSHQQALDHADKVARQTGLPWRVPTKEELETLIDKTRQNPAINTVVFPDTPSSRFWSSSPYVGNANLAWYVNYYGGVVDVSSRSYTNAVRLVRGG